MISEIVINKDKLLNNFKDIKKVLNLDIMKCYKVLFKKEGLVKNIGNYFMNLLIIMILILSILFKIKGFYNVKKQIKEITQNKEEAQKEKININTNNNKKKKEKENKAKFENKNNKKNKKCKIKKPKNKKFKIKKPKNKIFRMKTNGEKNNNIMRRNLEIKNSNVLINIQNSNINFLNNANKNNEQILINNRNKRILEKKNNNIIKLDDYELNELEYKKALNIDKRTYFQFYFSLLKTKHIIIFTFYTKNDYNSKIIKIILFLFSFFNYI